MTLGDAASAVAPDVSHGTDRADDGTTEAPHPGDEIAPRGKPLAGRRALAAEFAAMGTVVPPGASWQKRKLAGRRAPMGPGIYLHRLEPRTTKWSRHERRAAAKRARRAP